MWNGCSARRARPRCLSSRPSSIPPPARFSPAIRWSAGFGSRVAFADLARRADRLDRRPARIHRPQWRAGHPAALAARRTAVENARRRPRSLRGAAHRASSCAPGGSVEIVFLLGQAREAPTRRAALIERYRAADLDAVCRRGRAQLGRHARRRRRSRRRIAPWTSCSTAGCSTRPLACRLWARSAFYQASGAYGFRDQLQDVHGARRLAARP